MMSMADIETHGNIITVSMNTDITINNVETVEELLKEQLKKNPEILGINLSKVNSIDSSSIAMFVKLMKNYFQTKNPIVLYGPNPEVKEIFKIVKLETFFKILSLSEFQNRYLR